MKRLCIVMLYISTLALYTMAQENYTLEFEFQSNSIEGDYAILKRIIMSDSSDITLPEIVKNDGFNYYVKGMDLSIDGRQKGLLRSIKFPNSFVSVAGYYIPNAIIESSETFFSYCTNLSSVIFNNNIKYIGSKAFYGCGKLSFIEIPQSVTDISVNAFSHSGLTTAIIHCSCIFHMYDNDNDRPLFKYHPLYDCGSLSTLIYTNPIAPKRWVATTRTYVPDIEEYSSPFNNLTSTPHIIEMITFNENTFNYTGSAPMVTWKNNVEGYTATMDLSKLKADAGTYIDTIPVTFTGEHPFVANIPYRYTIKPIKLTAKVNSCSRQYGDENPQFSISYSGFLSGDNESVITTKPNLLTTALKTSDVGDYPITISGGSAANYEFVYEPGVLTVTKAPLTGKVNDATKMYGEQNPAFLIGYTGLKNGETNPVWIKSPIISTSATTASDVGQYDITATGGEARNYELSSITSGKLTITPAQLLITADDASMLYCSTIPNLTCKCTGFVGSDDEEVLSKMPKMQTNATQTSPVGTYPIEVSGAEAKNYMISYENGTLDILKRRLTASTKDYIRAYGEENPEFEISYSGFVNNEDEDVLQTKPQASTTATKRSDVGTYKISVGNGEAQNYEFLYIDGVLTIEKAYQTLSWEQDFSDAKQYDQVELLAEASSGLAITYSIEGDNIGSITKIGTKQYLDCSGAGEAVIVAQQEGDKNYWQTTKMYKSIKIVPTAVQDIINHAYPVKTIYDASGRKLSKLQRGVNVVVMKDGTTKKVVVK